MKVNSMRILLINALHCLNDWNSLSYCKEADRTADARGADLVSADACIYFSDCSDTVETLQEII